MSNKPTIADRVANFFGYYKGVALTTSAAMGFREYPAAKSTDQLGSYISWVYGCVKARATDVSKIQLKLYKVNRKTGETEDVEEHDSVSLLRSVNPFMTLKQLVEYTQAYKDLAGEAFWLLERAGNGSGLITQIWLLRPDYIDIKTSVTGFVSGYVYKVPGAQPIDLKVEEVIHHKEFNPLNPYRGMGVVRAAAVTIDTDEYADDYNKNFFRNSAQPDIVLSTEQKLTDAQVKRISAEWHNKYGGTRNAHKLAILEGGLEVQPFSMKHSEMEFLEGKGFNRDKIMALFQVPKTRLGMTDNVTVSNAEATINIYLKYVVKDLMERVADTLTEFLLPKYKGTEDMFFAIEDPVPEDVKVKLERLRGLFAIGALTPNEARHEQGFDEVEGLDGFYLAINQSAIAGEAGTPQQRVTNEEGKQVTFKAKKRATKVAVPPRRLKDKVAGDVSKKITAEVMAEITATMPKMVKKEVALPSSSWKPDVKEAFWKQLVDRSDANEKKYIELLKQYFDREEQEVVERLHAADRKAAGQKISSSDIENILISVVAENKIAADLLLPLVREILEQSGKDVVDFVGGDVEFDANTEAVRQFMRVDALKGLRVMNKTTKSLLRKALAQAVEEGLGPIVTARKIRDVFTEARQMRALRVARTETLKAANRGALEAYRQSGVVVGKEWFTSLDEGVCQWCGPLHGKVQALDNNFFNEGESYLGNKGGILRFNLEDIPTPPLHPNCRCTLIPITINQERSAEAPKQKNQDGDEVAEVLDAILSNEEV